MGETLLVIDAGTTSTRAMLFDAAGTALDVESAAIDQSYPRPGWVEHDADQIWTRSRDCARAVVDRAGGASRIAAIGITNQRETIVFWDRRTGHPLAPAIVWQDRRTADLCQALRERGDEPQVQAKTGLLLDPYFSAGKIAWALANLPDVRAAGDALAVGTVESWLVWNLTGGLHVTDATNASRTALMAIGSGGWDDGLTDLFDVPRRLLPDIVDCAGAIGTTRPDLFGGPLPITGMAGDQQAALIGQGCHAVGDVKATYGTGAFVLAQAGRRLPRSDHRLLATVAWQLDGVRHYALEGSIFVAGSLMQWLRDGLGLIADAGESEALARSVPDNAGVTLVPALAGLGAPHWAAGARAAIAGLSFSATRAHIVRAALESMAHQTRDLQAAFAADGVRWSSLRIDGGMVANDWLAQDLADILALPVERPDFRETTALGAAMLAAVGCGLHPDLPATAAMRGPCRDFAPALPAIDRDARLAAWDAAVARIL